ncbi:nicastrin domain-containing protein [Phthorimaea operculella]|nr:nicastrin domain-containing protein [Phthorimaea operculella]
MLLSVSSCERLHEQIYSSIEGGAACFRRLNGTHQAGCTSSDKGAVGVVHMINTLDDVQWMVHNATAGPYMVVVNTATFHSIVETLMNHPDNVAGVLLYDNSSAQATSFTQESRCPNEYYSAAGSQCSTSSAGGIVWNEMGTSLIRRDIPFPIFFLPESRIEEINKIQNCYERSASSALLTANKVCDPLGDHNVYYSLFPRNKEPANKKKAVTLVTARIDTASLFDGVAPGAASSAVGMVTLITAAATLSKMIPVKDSKLYDSNILWTLFNGEAFDYIGSQRVAYDLSRGSWPPVNPLRPVDVQLHVELGQIGGSLLAHKDENTWPLYAFTADIFDPSKITEFLSYMNSNTAAYNMTLTPKFTNNLPPSSIHSFRRILKNVTANGDLPEILLVDHAESFTNKFYHSVLDDYDKIGFAYHNISIGPNGTFISTDALLAAGNMTDRDPQVKIARLATAVARSLYQKVTGKAYDGDVSASAHLVDEMLYCFLQSQACRLLIAADYMQNGGGEETLPQRAASLGRHLAEHAGSVRGTPASAAHWEPSAGQPHDVGRHLAEHAGSVRGTPASAAHWEPSAGQPHDVSGATLTGEQSPLRHTLLVDLVSFIDDIHVIASNVNRTALRRVGVATWPSTPAVFAGHLLALLTGNHLQVNHTTCSKDTSVSISLCEYTSLYVGSPLGRARRQCSRTPASAAHWEPSAEPSVPFANSRRLHAGRRRRGDVAAARRLAVCRGRHLAEHAGSVRGTPASAAHWEPSAGQPHDV